MDHQVQQSQKATVSKSKRSAATAKKYNRGRSLRACLTCSKRKVRCDLMKKNHPHEKCTNCEEFGVDCTLAERKKRGRKKKQTTPNVSPNKEKKPILDCLSPGIVQQENGKRPAFTPDGFDRHSTSESSNAIIVDPIRSLSSRFRVSSFTQYLINVTPSPIFSVATMQYMNCEDGFDSSLASKSLDPLAVEFCKSAGVFTLPSKTECDQYIEAYFRAFSPFLPIINKANFMETYTDLGNPPSLLVLRSVLFVGSMVCSCEGSLSSTDSGLPRNMFRVAKVLLNSDFETRPIPIVQSKILLSYSSANDIALTTRCNLIDSAIDTAYLFSMHLDQTNNVLLTDYEKHMYKLLFWHLFYLDRILSLTFSRTFRIIMVNCTVSVLTEEELYAIYSTDDPKKTRLMIDYSIAVIRFCELLGEVREQQSLIFKRGLKGISIASNINHIIDLISNCYYALPSSMLDESSSKYFYHNVRLYYTILKVFIYQTNIAFRHLLLIKIIGDSGSKKLLASLNGFNKTSYYKVCADLLHIIMESTSLLNNNPVFFQFYIHATSMTLHAAMSLLPLLYHRDEHIRQRALGDLEKFNIFLKGIEALDLDYSSSLSVKSGIFFFNHIYPDKKKLVEYMRHVLNSEYCETIFKKNSNDGIGDDHHLGQISIKQLVLEEIPPLLAPIYNINLSENCMDEDESYEKSSEDFHNNKDDSTGIDFNSEISVPFCGALRGFAI